MAATPKKGVHWNFDDISFSELNSPSGSSTDSFVSTSSFEYANAQLIAHGFVQAPGLCLEGISAKDSENVVKCLLNLLSQRVEDMARTEELSTKLRTMTYDHERLTSMHRTAVEKAANAEREANLHKSRLNATLRTLHTTENAHKQTTAELQRTRTSLQAIRSTHQAELKKREKEIERLTEKWQKIAELQTKLAAIPSGIQCANVDVVEGRGFGHCPSYLDVALEEAEKARTALLEDNNYLKALALKAVNAIQRIIYQTNGLLSTNEEQLMPYTVSTLFPMAPKSYPADTLNLLLNGLRDSLETVTERLANPPQASTTPEPNANAKAMNTEIARLQKIIENLQTELDRCHNQLETQAEEIQSMFEQFAEQQRTSAKEFEEVSVELMSAPLHDEEKERLERIKQELDQERQKFTQAAIKFGKEKSALEAERVKFLDEKRAWEMEKMLDDIPPSPEPQPPAPVKQMKSYKQSPRKGAFKSPKKSSPKKSPGKTKASSSYARQSRISLGSPKKIIPAGETEILPMPSLTFSMMGSLAPPTSLLSTTFVLPPPSPHASLPPGPALPPPIKLSPPEWIKAKSSSAEPSSSGRPLAEAELEPELDLLTPPPPTKQPFPVAKPFAQRMVHAYSPAKPSPLSRILLLSQSPVGGEGLSAVEESQEERSGDLSVDFDDGGFAPLPAPAPVEAPQMSLAQELGVSESPPDTPLQERNAVGSGGASSKSVVGGPIKGRVLFPEAKSRKPSTTAAKTTAAAKAKVGASKPTKAGTSTVSREKTGAGTSKAPTRGVVGEKENDGTGSGRTLKVNAKPSSGKVSPVFKPPATTSTGVKKKGPSPTTSTAVPGKASSTTTTKPSSSSKTDTGTAKPSGRPPSAQGARPATGGPRRVPVNSAEAAPVKSRRG
ncbi:hypothetical protein H1R20_g7423, partial [Candolleomyces eurysporus]